MFTMFTITTVYVVQYSDVHALQVGCSFTCVVNLQETGIVVLLYFVVDRVRVQGYIVSEKGPRSGYHVPEYFLLVISSFSFCSALRGLQIAFFALLLHLELRPKKKWIGIPEDSLIHEDLQFVHHMPFALPQISLAGVRPHQVVV